MTVQNTEPDRGWLYDVAVVAFSFGSVWFLLWFLGAVVEAVVD